MTDTPQTAPQGLDDFLGFLDDDRLEIPHVPSTKHPRSEGGKTYYVEQPDAETGARIAALGQIMAKMQAKVDVSENDVRKLRMRDDEERDFQDDVLGATRAEMIEDGVNHQHLKMATNYAFVAFAFTEDQARKMAEAGALTGKAVPSEAPSNREERRRAPKGKGKSKGNPAKG
jgi:hypothetical protein